MRYRITPVVFALCVVRFSDPNCAAQVIDRSCVAVQRITFQARLDRLPEAEKQQYQEKQAALASQMDNIIKKSEPIETRLHSIVASHRDALLQSRPELNKNEKEFQRELLRRLEQDPAYDAAAAAALQMQLREFHRLESQQKKAVLEVPPPRAEYEQKVESAARQFVTERKFSEQQAKTIMDSQAYRELVTAVVAAQRAAAGSLEQSGMEFAAAESRHVFDEKDAPVVQAASMLRGAMRDLEALHLRGRLTADHIDHFTGNAKQRASLMANPDKELARSTAKGTGEYVQQITLSKEGSRRLKQIEVPPPPVPDPKSETSIRRWEKSVAENAKSAAGLIVTIIHVD